MGMEADAVLAGELAEAAERLGAKAIRPVRRDAAGDAAVRLAVPVLEELLRLLQALLDQARIPGAVDAAEADLRAVDLADLGADDRRAVRPP